MQLRCREDSGGNRLGVMSRCDRVLVVTHGRASFWSSHSVRRQFSSEELANLALAITMINSWNRMNIAFRTIPGDYRPGMFQTQREAASQRGVRQTHSAPAAPQ